MVVHSVVFLVHDVMCSMMVHSVVFLVHDVMCPMVVHCVLFLVHDVMCPMVVHDVIICFQCFTFIYFSYTVILSSHLLSQSKWLFPSSEGLLLEMQKASFYAHIFLRKFLEFCLVFWSLCLCIPELQLGLMQYIAEKWLLKHSVIFKDAYHNYHVEQHLVHSA